jgi:hypothetical protein
MAPEHGDGIERKTADTPGKNLRTGGIVQKIMGNFALASGANARTITIGERHPTATCPAPP